ncbi:MAG: ABC transporter ATP-binding protein [Anaerolineae bacterium]|nr:ABC transporter ATP-binding protein [Anaerolineae bacterium]
MRLEAESLSHSYSGKQPLEALRRVSLSIPAGQFVALIGPSGCGKSTFLRLAANLLPVRSGSLLLDGQPPRAAVAQQRVAWMAQSPALLPWRTVRANVLLAGQIQNHGSRPRLDAEEALARVGLSDMAGSYPAELSGGMQQRLALARTLTLPASLWLMDEPFAALDELTRERLAGELLGLWQPIGATVLWVTHNIHEAARLADRALVFSQRPGSIVADIPIPLARPRREADPDYQSVVTSIRTGLGMAETGVSS